MVKVPKDNNTKEICRWGIIQANQIRM